MKKILFLTLFTVFGISGLAKPMKTPTPSKESGVTISSISSYFKAKAISIYNALIGLVYKPKKPVAKTQRFDLTYLNRVRPGREEEEEAACEFEADTYEQAIARGTCSRPVNEDQINEDFQLAQSLELSLKLDSQEDIRRQVELDRELAESLKGKP